MIEDYKSALRAGQRTYRTCVSRSQPPYLAVLDDTVLNVPIVGQESLGLVNIPSEFIIGTKTSGRHTAFAPNFMPLLDENTEFASKWSNLCEAHLNEGIRTPIVAYEFLNRFYVQEGNKRVSVLKYFDSPTIPGVVTRLIPARSESKENHIYYEFLDFYRLSQLNTVEFTRLGSYARLQQAVCKASDETWDDTDRQNFSAFYTIFCKQFYALGGKELCLTAGDALLVYLSFYRYADACETSPAQLRENLSNLWEEVTVLTEDDAVELSLEPEESHEHTLFSRLSSFVPHGGELNVVFLHEHSADNSAWVASHERARAVLENTFPERLHITCRDCISPTVDAEQVIEQVVQDGADVVFTTSVGMLPACLRAAAQYPHAKILNCSLNVPHPTLRTYYPRIYEATYLLGLLAGVLSPSNVVGYAATYPIYGVPAAINAFAQGVRAVRPKARVLLRWGCMPEPGKPLDFSDRDDVSVFFAQDNREPGDAHRDFGLCRRLMDGSLETLARPHWCWDVIYSAIIRTILNGSWDTLANGRAVNYWWGLRSGAIRLTYSASIPTGTMQLLDLMELQLSEGSLRIFPPALYSQGHILRKAENIVYSPEELMRLDWLDECVEGTFPLHDALDVKSQCITDAIGLDIIK